MRRIDGGRLLVALLCGLLGFGLVVSVRATSAPSALAGAREDDLVRILDDLDARNERLRRELADLTAARDRLAAGSGDADAALAETRERLATLGVLAGTLPATGPGVLVTLEDPQRRLRAASLVDAVQELRDAGAEAMTIGDGGRAGRVVRVVVSTSVLEHPGGLAVDGVELAPPYAVTALGDPPTLAAALRIPGGVVDAVARTPGARAVVEERPELRIDALRPAEAPRYARPARGPDGG